MKAGRRVMQYPSNRTAGLCVQSGLKGGKGTSGYCHSYGGKYQGNGYIGGVAGYLSLGILNNCTFSNNDGLKDAGRNDIGKIITAEEEKPTPRPVSPVTPTDAPINITVYAEDGVIIAATYFK